MEIFTNIFPNQKRLKSFVLPLIGQLLRGVGRLYKAVAPNGAKSIRGAGNNKVDLSLSNLIYEETVFYNRLDGGVGNFFFAFITLAFFGRWLNCTKVHALNNGGRHKIKFVLIADLLFSAHRAKEKLTRCFSSAFACRNS
jgi:hypothetical protein